MSHFRSRAALFTMAVGLVCLQAAQAPAAAQEREVPQGYKERGPIDMTIGAQRLDNDQVAKLEKQLAENPNDLKIRIQLLNHYARKHTPSARQASLDHIAWLVANKPQVRFLGTPVCRFDRSTDPEAYEQLRDLWLQQVKAHPEDAAVIGNAARFMLRSDQQVAEDLLNMCRVVDPKNAQCVKLLRTINAFNKAREERESEAADPAVEAFEDLKRTYDLTAEKTQKELLLAELAKAAFAAGAYDEAGAYAHQALEAVDDLSRDNVQGEALHHGHVILGRLDMMNGQITSAKEHLLEAGKTPGSPALDSFGPNMTLAKELLEAGETDVVLEYFRLCAQFWKHGEKRLAEWTEAVKQGSMPDFGSSLEN
jgi:tetratricopeptide (TPR) repeat protein